MPCPGPHAVATGARACGHCRVGCASQIEHGSKAGVAGSPQLSEAEGIVKEADAAEEAAEAEEEEEEI